MYLHPNLALICPLDGKPLARYEDQLSCDNGHSFDIARQGYVNLLPVQQKKSKQPGDSKEMIIARHRFLEAGYYLPVADKLNEIVASLTAGDSGITLLDAGCGEGYYLAHCLQFLKCLSVTRDVVCLGMDISKPAIIAAAKRKDEITWVVGTNKSPPVEIQSVDIIICMFGFYDMDVFAKALKPGGYVILADADNEHLLELRQIIYPYIKSASARRDFSGFDLLSSLSLNYTIRLDQSTLADLLLMTPHLYRAPKVGKEAVKALSALNLTVDVLFRVFQCHKT